MKSKLFQAITLSVLLLCAGWVSGCQTVGDIRYVVAAEAADDGDYETSFEQYLVLANDDSYHDQSSAQFSVANAYIKGRGVQRDVNEGIRWLEKASRDKKDRKWAALALTDLAMIYETGIVGQISKDVLKAARYHKRAYEMGSDTSGQQLQFLGEDPEIYTAIHEEYFSPDGSTKAGEVSEIQTIFKTNPKKAFRIADWHARHGDVLAQRFLSEMYAGGVGIEKDMAFAARWLYLAAENGSPEAQYNLASNYYSGDFIPINFSKYEYWLEEASEQDYPDALNDLGAYLMDPLEAGRSPDREEAFSLYQRAASLGNMYALSNLGDFYAAGVLVEKDVEKAAAYYQQAIDAGYGEAENSLRDLTGEPGTVVIKEKTIVTETVIKEVASTGPDAKSIFAMLNPSVIKLIVAQFENTGDGMEVSGGGSGSGVAITHELAITNCHVIEDMDIVVIEHQGERGAAKVVKRYLDEDICYLKSIDMELVPVQKYRKLSTVEVGEIAYAIGSPKGLENTLSAGHVSGIREDEEGEWIQTSAPISPGSSGGGLFDEDGELLGITTWQLQDAESLNFAKPAEKYVEEILRVFSGS